MFVVEGGWPLVKAEKSQSYNGAGEFDRNFTFLLINLTLGHIILHIFYKQAIIVFG